MSVHNPGPWGKLVDLMFLIATVGALTISLVVTAATFTRGLSALTGLPDNFTVQAFVILLSGGIKPEKHTGGSSTEAVG